MPANSWLGFEIIVVYNNVGCKTIKQNMKNSGGGINNNKIDSRTHYTALTDQKPNKPYSNIQTIYTATKMMLLKIMMIWTVKLAYFWCVQIGAFDACLIAIWLLIKFHMRMKKVQIPREKNCTHKMLMIRDVFPE